MQPDTSKFPFKVDIPWRYGDTINSWNDVCADCVEKYGLPGDKYITSVYADHMTFFFKNHGDAMWFKLQVQ